MLETPSVVESDGEPLETPSLVDCDDAALVGASVVLMAVSAIPVDCDSTEVVAVFEPLVLAAEPVVAPLVEPLEYTWRAHCPPHVSLLSPVHGSLQLADVQSTVAGSVEEHQHSSPFSVAAYG